MVKRRLAEILARSKKSILLLGPRQTGKSTLIKSLRPEMTINLSFESEFFRFSTQPGLLESIISEEKPKSVFIDEIQRIPSLLNSIQGILDDMKTPPKFYLSGSSARKLKRGHANLLPGRIFTFHLSGLCAAELDYVMDYKSILAFGALPEPLLELDLNTKRKILRNYSATYLKEEIQAETLLRNIQGFARFLMTIAEFSGAICDFSKISSKANVSRTSCIRFVEILEDTLIAERIPVFQESKSADTIKHPKIFFFDVGVLNGLLGNFEISADRVGLLFEHFIYNQIRNSAMAFDEDIQIEYFRTRHGLVIDFIIKLKNKVWAIEVKSGVVKKLDLEPLKAFQRYYPGVHKMMIVSAREKRRVQDGILICSWQEMLKELGF